MVQKRLSEIQHAPRPAGQDARRSSELRHDQPRPVANALYHLGFLLISLNSFYFPQLGLPVVPFAGATITLAAVWLDHASRAQRSIGGGFFVFNAIALAILCLLATLSGTLGSFETYYYKTVVGYGLGFMIFFALSNYGDRLEYIHRLVSRIAWLHVTAYGIQFFSYITTGKIVDYIYPITGEFSRLEGSQITRFTGLWAEPAMYATFSYGCLVARLAFQDLRFKLLDALLVVSILISRSASGYGLLLFLSIVFAVRGIRRPSNLLRLVLVLTFGALAVAFSGIDLYGVLDRIKYFSDDYSGAIRFLGFNESYATLSWMQRIFGAGIGSQQALETGHNGIYMGIIGWGAIGVATWLAMIAFNWKRQKRRWLPLLMWSGSLVAAPQQTWPYWWMILGATAIGSRVRPPRSSERQKPRPPEQTLPLSNPPRGLPLKA